jgi:hypothetical protein
MHAPQILWIIGATVGLTASLLTHGQERKPENFWAQLIATTMTVGLLIWGGFFGR